jgi:hypothetical protein
MLATPDAQKVVFAVAVLISLLVALVAPKGKRGLAFIGCQFGLTGLIGILSGIIPQRWRGGPPLEGSLAMFGSLLIVLIGVYITFLAFSKRSRDHTQTDESKPDLTNR